MTLSAGTRLGPYEILAPLGAGGMGEVYRARDARLDRFVAVKVLPEQLAASADFKQRFEREAKAISSLNHPNICHLYDVGSQDGVEYLVMELLEGETLAERLKRGPLTTEQVRRHGMEIAEALDKAHRQGIVHRDLKPGNVMMTPAGAKLMDFGLAKPGTPRNGTSGLTSLPTQTTPLTSEGTLVGTFQYMSPEQLEGKDADARSDLFAFGAVLYEMATGRKAFEGKSQISVMAAILEKEPVPMAELQPMTPPALERLVQTCLKKDPEERLQSARDVKLHLEWIGEAGSRAGVPAPVIAKRKARFRLAWALAALGLLLAAVSVFAYLRVASVHPRTVRAYVLPPEKCTFAFDAATGGPVLSPDGTRIVFPALDASGKKLLWVRPLDSLTAQPLEGTDDASFPFWSPDSRFLGFFSPGKLKKIDTVGGPPQTVCSVSTGRGGTWSPKGVILFTPDVFGGIQKVSSAGGAAADLLGLDKTREQTSLRWPVFLPDGQHFLYWGGNPTATAQDTNGIYVASLDDKAGRFLCQADSDALYAPPGYLLFLRDRSLMAQPFDAGSQKLTGEAFPIAEEVANRMSFRLGCFSASSDGSLVYQTGENVRVQPIWLNASGGEAGAAGELGDIIAVRFSPDGKRLAEEIQDPRTKAIDLWILDLDRNVKTRFTFDAAPHFFPAWSPDGANIAYSSTIKGHFDVYTKSASGAGEASLLYASDADKYVTDWSRDGRYISITQVDSKSKTLGDIFIVPLAGDHKPFPFLQTSFNEANGVFSPDGHWLGYQSNESGKMEIYVMPFPGPGGKWQVSQGGGVLPRWRADGKALYYRTPDDKLMEAAILQKGGALEVSTPRQIAKVPFAELGGTGWVYDAAPKDGKFIFLRPEQAASTPITLVTRWADGVKR